jgi:hypothetical protein
VNSLEGEIRGWKRNGVKLPPARSARHGCANEFAADVLLFDLLRLLDKWKAKSN